MQTESFQQQVLIIKKEKNMKSYVLHFMFCERVETCPRLAYKVWNICMYITIKTYVMLMYIL